MEEPSKILNGGNSLRPQKRIFLGLLAVTCLLFTIILAVLWYVPYVGLSNLNPHLPLILGVFFTALLLLTVGGLLVLAQHSRATPENLLLLMPHCLQFHECKFRITGNIVHCQRCGKCPIKGLAELSEKYG